MFNIYLPEPIYKRLPLIYLAVAAVLVVMPLAPFKWIPVAALLLATVLTHSLRYENRRQAQPSPGQER